MPIAALSPTRVAVIGAGIAGLSAAAALQAGGHEVTLFDKSRGPGGRCATRRSAAGPFDHGAAALHAVTAEFAEQVVAWQADGWLAATTDVPGVDANADAAPPATTPRWVGVPSMNALAQRLAQSMSLCTDTHIAALEPGDAGWALRTLQAELLPGRYDAVALALPAEQAVALLAAAPALADAMRGTPSDPCWTVLAAWPGPLPFDASAWPPGAAASAGASAPTHPVLASVRRDDQRPGREPVSGVASRWVLHATPAWSREHLEAAPEAVAHRLIQCWSEALGLQLSRPSFCVAHRWRYAQVPSPRAEACGWNAALRLGACGDAWHARPGASGIERAWLSGRALAAQIVGYSGAQAGGSAT